MSTINKLKELYPITKATSDNERFQLNNILEQLILYLENIDGSSSNTEESSSTTFSSEDFIQEEEDPIFNDSAASTIDSSDILNWDLAYDYLSGSIVGIHALADVTSSGSIRTIDYDKGLIQTLRTTAALNLHGTGTTGESVPYVVLHIWNDSASSVKISPIESNGMNHDESFLSITAGDTGILFMLWNGDNSYRIIDFYVVSGDQRPSGTFA